MSISAADVKKLRDITAAGMMECKKALEESNGDFDKAVELLRISGAAKAAKRGAERETSAGIVSHNAGVLVELLCETDFVAKSEDFLKLGDEIAAAVQAAGAKDAAAPTTVAWDSAAIKRLRMRNRCLCGLAPGGASLTITPVSLMRESNPRCETG